MAGAAASAPRDAEINMNRLGEVLGPDFQPPIRAFSSTTAIPVSTVPEQNKIREGLLREDLFTVVHEQVFTDTARYADVLLPATTFLEHAELRRSYGAMLAQYSQPVIEPVGEARSNHWLFGELCRRMGLTRPGDPETPDDLVQAIVATSPSGAELAESFAATGRRFRPVAGGRCRLSMSFPGRRPSDRSCARSRSIRRALKGFTPITRFRKARSFLSSLISPSTSKAISSTLYQLVQGTVPLEMNPADARVRGIADGDAVRMFNDSGEVRCAAKISSDVRPGVVVMPKGLWARHTHNGQTTNALVPDTLSDVGGGACFNDSRVQIERTNGSRS